MSQSRFDLAAATWDEEPRRVQLAMRIADVIRTQTPVTAEMTAIDFGCGTGLLTLALQPYVQRIIGVDASVGMLEVLEEKIRVLDITNVETRLIDPAKELLPPVPVDLIVSAMTLHHVPDVPRLLRAMVEQLVPGGYLALADLDREDGSFHDDMTEVYHTGFDREWLQEQLSALGCIDLQATTVHTIDKGEGRRYSIFLVSGQRRPLA